MPYSTSYICRDQHQPPKSQLLPLSKAQAPIVDMIHPCSINKGNPGAGTKARLEWEQGVLAALPLLD
jgi:hypothetical protein